MHTLRVFIKSKCLLFVIAHFFNKWIFIIIRDFQLKRRQLITMTAAYEGASIPNLISHSHLFALITISCLFQFVLFLSPLPTLGYVRDSYG